MAIDVILGLQWGDEGKGKIVDYLASQYDVVARFQGGPNAGHTLKFDGQKFVLHTIPSGIFRKNLINLIGNGVVIDPITLEKELKKLDEVGTDYKDRLFIANKAHLILPTHRYIDAASEAAKGVEKIGSTLKGIGPTYMDKTGRNGLRVGDVFSPNFREKYELLRAKHLGLLKLYPEFDFNLEKEEAVWFESIEVLKKLINVDGEYFINDQLKQGKKVLAEGAQGSMLDIDFGTYPFVTSSNTVTSGVCNGLGVSPHQIGEVIGITKAYCTRVGGGPFPTELLNATGERLREAGGEFGATTGRPRRCGWLDIPQLRYTIMLNGVTKLVITKIDVLDEFEEIGVSLAYRYNGTLTDRMPFDICDGVIEPVYEMHAGWNTVLSGKTDFDGLPEAASNYVKFLEEKLETPISIISVGPEREQLILRDIIEVV
ncbi:MAG: adenylosuccinate synthase [Saprospiraceae bacterium]|nr:adenylosuccinate synthase [Saprospiraceae bacterium]